jgi:hypothetical protein
MLLGLKRKPWFYGFTNENPKLKTPSFRKALIALFSIHTLLAIGYSTKVKAFRFEITASIYNLEAVLGKIYLFGSE